MILAMSMGHSEKQPYEVVGFAIHLLSFIDIFLIQCSFFNGNLFKLFANLLLLFSPITFFNIHNFSFKVLKAHQRNFHQI